ncbi:bifunctional copper resistance protein CopD/cytochrome c oxidase assembly protein [Nesterenkonia sp. MY13]|uniref:Bifunctional copper resistance protein CopD/cytochrome c oxidase assembly protein n=1 Tax=Nesterenkonia sedimenti TaxID=1463632 RepID=A0A7X8TIG0_9MICC|nr:cytochrome c oxidase assembly protein [Nesterenkonia sedimenti]NLS09199.1 bifunctional copper resistance protein CopD/cytochrome c oxidase assembly protein [Nesterenkonia sedimenti]
MTTTTPTEPRSRTWSAPLPLTTAALCTGLIALIIAGAATGMGEVGQISDPGAVTRWGLPVARYIHHIAMATAVAAAILVAIALPRYTGPRQRPKHEKAGRTEHPLYTRSLQIAMAASVVWTVAAIAVLVLTFSSLAGLPVSSDQAFSEGFFDYALNIATGQAWLAIVLIAGIFATLIAAIRNPAGVGFLAVFGLCAIVPMAMVGHSSSGDDHTAAVNSLGLHLLGVVVWVGGLTVLALLGPEIARTARTLSTADQGGEQILGTLLRRYSVLAGLALVTVAASGVINADLRVAGLNQLLGTDYGLMLVAKTVATLALAAIGFAHRSWLIPRLSGSALGTAAEPTAAEKTSTSSSSVGNLLWRLIIVEIAIMAAVIGISSVLGRTAPPVPEELPPDATPARQLTGYDLPPEPSLGNFFTLWRPDWLWIAVIAFLAIWYLRSMIRVRSRGIAWPVMRAVSWLFGLAVLLWITSGGPAVYGMVTFSGHMIQHMTLTMVAPIFLVMGSPVTLAMRAMPIRRDGTRGAREWILWLVHSTWSKIVTNPIVAAVNFAGSIVLFYYTPIFGWALEYHLGHILMTVHFLLTGYIFALVLIGRDPLPSRPPHFLRVIILLATMVFHAFFAVALMSAETLIQPDWFGNMGHGWFPAIDDQRNGGELMWGLGEVPAVVLGVIACIQWAKDDKREMKRIDREADRTGDAELQAYNRMFEDMADRNRSAR